MENIEPPMLTQRNYSALRRFIMGEPRGKYRLVSDEPDSVFNGAVADGVIPAAEIVEESGGVGAPERTFGALKVNRFLGRFGGSRTVKLEVPVRNYLSKVIGALEEIDIHHHNYERNMLIEQLHKLDSAFSACANSPNLQELEYKDCIQIENACVTLNKVRFFMEKVAGEHGLSFGDWRGAGLGGFSEFSRDVAGFCRALEVVLHGRQAEHSSGFER